MGNYFEKELTDEEKANKKLEIPIKDLKVRDKAEELKLKFPFYRMEIKAFEFKLNHIQLHNFGNKQNERWKLRTVSTDIMTVD